MKILGGILFSFLLPIVAKGQSLTPSYPQLTSNGSPVGVFNCTTAEHTNMVDIDTETGTPGGTGSRLWTCDNHTGTYQWNQLGFPITGTTVSIGGAILAVGGTVSGAASVPGAIQGQVCTCGTSDGTIVAGVTRQCDVTSNGTATVTLTAAVLGTPAAKTYNVRVIP